MWRERERKREDKLDDGGEMVTTGNEGRLNLIIEET